MQDGIFYKHYRTAAGAMTFAVERKAPTAEMHKGRSVVRPSIYRVGCAFCSPLDLGRFSRKRGRQIARSRIRSAPQVRGIVLGDGGAPEYYVVMDSIITRMVAERDRYDREEAPDGCWREEPGVPRWFPAFATELREQLAAARRARGAGAPAAVEA